MVREQFLHDLVISYYIPKWAGLVLQVLHVPEGSLEGACCLEQVFLNVLLNEQCYRELEAFWVLPNLPPRTKQFQLQNAEAWEHQRCCRIGAIADAFVLQCVGAFSRI